MDDTFCLALILIFLSLVAAQPSSAGADVEYKYIAPIERQNLAGDFDRATVPEPVALAKALNHTFSCDMYGMRTQMQVQHGMRLYTFKVDSKTWTNAGSLPITRYALIDGSLTGENPKVRDRVRISAKGELIAKLTGIGMPETVVAYSVCRPI